MGLLITLAVGLLLGWLAGILTRSAASGLALNLILGTIGALLGAFLLGPLIGGGNLLDAILDPRTVLIASIGAVLLLGLVHLGRSRLRRRSVRPEGAAADPSLQFERDVEGH